MADNYYSDAASGGGGAAAGGDDDEGDESQEKSGSDSALLPKSMFKGKAITPGQTVPFKIVADHGDEVEVTCDKGEDNSNQQPDSQDMQDAMGQLGAMGGGGQ